MPSLGGTHLLVLLLVVVLLLDSRRLRALVGATVGHRRDAVSGPGIPAGAYGDKVGLPLRQVQMRIHVDWEDGGIGWDGPEILPDDGPPIEAEPNPLLPVLWEPFPAFLDISAWYAREESTLHPPGKEPGALVELRAHGESSPPAQWPTVVPSARTA
jgi:hypothetical protein